MYHISASSGDKTWNIFPIPCDDPETAAFFRIPRHDACPNEILSLHLTFMDADAGDDGYYVLNSHLCAFLTRFRSRDDATYSTTQSVLPFVGAKLGDKAYLLLVEGMPYGFRVTAAVKDNQYSLSLSYDQKYRDLYEDVCLRLIILTGKEATYAGMARAYRKIAAKRKHLIPLAERIKTEPVITYGATDMPVIRVRMAWKPVPTPVDEQTPETEPPMHVACTFRDVSLLMDEMKLAGIPKAEFCLVGWNVKGHDGRWPQMFPVEEALGGEEELCKLIAHAAELGYRVSAHVNHSDAYRIADTWSEGDIIIKKDGSFSVNGDSWSGGRMYHLCPKVAYEKYIRRDIPKLKALGFSGFHYIDVISLIPPRTCCSPAHPLTAAESARYSNRVLSLARQELGGVGSEGGNDFCIENLDFALYMAYNLLSGAPRLADELIPLWQLVYHGYVLSNPSAETVNFFIKSPETQLRFYEFGGIPVVYFYSRFVNEGARTNWMGREDMRCATDMERRESAQIIKTMLDTYEGFTHRRLAFMDDHRKIDEGIFETVYSDGWHTLVNYTERDYQFGSLTVPAKNMIQFHAKSRPPA